jgi:sugar/nucleoside kinase (ribokinase family)
MVGLPRATDQPGSGSNKSLSVDIVGIGALNLDYIAGSEAIYNLQVGSFQDSIRRLIADTGIEAEFGTETFVDAAVIDKILKMDARPRFHAALGGSSFNTIYTLGQSGIPLRLGFVGVAGHVPVPELSAIAEMDALGINHRYVLLNNRRTCGICVSFMLEGERTLLTHGGANALMCGYLESMADSIAMFLSKARFVHISAFPDKNTARPLVSILRHAKRMNPAIRFTFDPGHVWSSQRNSDIDLLFQLSDYLILNQREFHEIGRYVRGDSDLDVAGRIAQGLLCEQGVIMVKRRTGTSYFRSFNGQLVSGFFPQVVLDDSQIQDATGAGDVFAAGLLILLASDTIHIELGSILGMLLARHKMQHVGGYGTRYAEVARNFIESRRSIET